MSYLHRLHFRNLAFMENDTTKQLYVVVNHVPHRVVTTGYPVILINGFVSLDAYKSFVVASWRSNSVAVTTISSFSAKRLAVCLNDGESNGQYFVQCFFIFLQNSFSILSICANTSSRSSSSRLSILAFSSSTFARSAVC